MEKTFEQLMSDLEKIVRDLESEQLSLEDSIKKYQEGIEVSKECYDRLTEAKEILVKKQD